MTTTDAPDTRQTPRSRYALYFAPRVGSPWWEAGSRWLGRCAATGRVFDPPALADVTAGQWRDLTADPRRYGWHATLKAPFALAPGHTLADLLGAVRALAEDFSTFELPPLQACSMGRFLALRPVGPSPGLEAVAAACVTRLQPLAAPLTASDLARRRLANLSPRQDEFLVRWGYPWVLSEFRFHCSLTGDIAALDPRVQAAVMREARARFDALPACVFGHLSLFAEPAPGADFTLLEQVELRA